MKKKIIFLFLIFAAVIVFLPPGIESKTQPYYSGDAIVFNDRIFIGTTNTKAFELFTFDSGKIIRQVVIAVPPRYEGVDNFFYDFKFNKEDKKLYVYLTDGRYLYKYNLDIPSRPKLINKFKSNIWSWFSGINMTPDNLATIGKEGIKIWNSDFQIVNLYNLFNKYYPGNISFSPKGNFIFNIIDNNLAIFNVLEREIIKKIPLNIIEAHNRKIFNDHIESLIYVVDDSSLKAFNFNGILKKEFKHTSDLGYDVSGLEGSEYLYFSDGIGVVKSRKSDLKPVDWVYTTDLGIQGGWAMGLEAVRSSRGEKIIVFNNSSILVLDKDLELVDYYKAVEEDNSPPENLWLSVDKNKAAPGSLISLRGGGYGLKEKVRIIFAKEEYIIQADDKGRFATIITVPSVLPARTDIKVVGEYSGLNYSIAFNIE